MSDASGLTSAEGSLGTLASASMLKHPDLTRRRLTRFLLDELTPALIGERQPLKIETNANPARNQAEAELGPWEEVARGFEYGPAYTFRWFRLSGRVPEGWAGKHVSIIAEVGGERTLWKDGEPWRGVDHEHSDLGILEGKGFSPEETVEGGEEVSYIFQVYTRNAQVRIQGREPAREPLVERVEAAEMFVVDRELKALVYDFEFTMLLLDEYPETDPGAAVLLRALNDVVNLWARAGRRSLAQARRIIKDAQNSLNGELAHTIVPVGHAHLDTAWLWPLAITHLKMAHTTATQLSLMERYPEYVFCHSQASQYEWLEEEYPGLFARVKAAIERGQWEPVGSMWVEADCNLTGGESLVRQFLYGRRYFRERFGVTTGDMWLPDVFGYSAALPQILAKFNIEAFMTQKISWNQVNRFPHHTFYWQGIDGTKMWTHFLPADTYNANAEPKEVIFSVKNFKDHGRSDQSLYVYGWGDGGGGPTERHLEFLRRGTQAPNYPEVALGKKASDFFRDAKRGSKDLQTWSGELYFELHRGTYTSQAANKKANRASEFLLRDAEYLATFARGANPYPREELERAWKLVLLNQFHDIIPGTSVTEVYEDSARDYAAVREAGERIVGDALRAIAAPLVSEGSSRPVALFQNASAPAQGEIALSEDEAPPGALIVNGETIPVQAVEAFGERTLVFPVPMAAQGAVAVGDLVETAPDARRGDGARPRLKAGTRRLENGEWVVRFDMNGNISSIASLEDGTEFLEPGRLGNVFQLFDDHPLSWSAWDLDAFSLETGTDLLRSDSFEIVERGPVRVAADLVKTFGKSTIRQRISLGPTPGIRFDTEIDWREEEKLLKVAFPANVNANRATYEIQFGNVERPTHVNTTWDWARFEVCAQKWVDLSEGDQGLALINAGKYGHDVRGNALRLTLLRAPKAPDPFCDMGVHRFSYTLLPHFGGYKEAGVVAAAYAFNAPLRVVELEVGSAGAGGPLPPFALCHDQNVVIETVKKAEDSDDVIVRLYECHNSRGHAELILATPPGGAWLCDLEENELGEIEMTDGTVPFAYKPFEIITIKIRL